MTQRFLHSILGLLVLAVGAGAETVSLEQFGGKADGKADDGPAMAAALAFAGAHPGTTLHLGGVCRIDTPQYRNGPDPAHAVPMAAGGIGISGLAIEDGEILLGGSFGGFYFKKCPGVTFRNVTFDYDPPLVSQGRIVASDRAARTFTVVPDAGYPPPDSPTFLPSDWVTVHKPDGDYAFFFVGHLHSAVAAPDGRVVLAHDRPDLAAVVEGKPDLRYFRVQRNLAHHLLLFEFCDGARLENCSIYGTSAFTGLFVCCNDVTLAGNRICPRPDSGRIASTSADGFDFIAARRGPRIEDNFFDRLEDDNLVISLRGNKVQAHHGAELQLLPQSGTWYEVGDTVEVVSVAEGMRREYKIAAMAPQANLFAPPALTLDRPLEGEVTDFGGDYPTMVYNKSWRLDGTVIRHNTFQNTRRYAVFMGAGGVLIEDNTMSNFTGAALVLSSTENLKAGRGNLNYYPSRDIVVRNNRISGAFDNGEEGRAFVTPPLGAIELADVTRALLDVGDLRLARDITIQDNTITDCGGAGIYIANASNVTITGNTITNPNLRQKKDRYGIWVQSSDASVTDNTVQGTGIDAPVKIDPGPR